jgi:hypothetical protein
MIREELIPQAISMFEENVEMDVVPAGFAYIEEGAELNEALLQKHGRRLYIDGDLVLTAGSDNCFDKVEGLRVNGNVCRQAEALARVDADYRQLIFVKGRYVSNKSYVVVDKAMLEASPDGLEIGNCAALKVNQDVSPELILENLSVRNCAKVFCSPEQKSVLQLVCENVAKIIDAAKTDSEAGEEEADEDILGMLEEDEDRECGYLYFVGSDLLKNAFNLRK